MSTKAQLIALLTLVSAAALLTALYFSMPEMSYIPSVQQAARNDKNNLKFNNASSRTKKQPSGSEVYKDKIEDSLGSGNAPKINKELNLQGAENRPRRPSLQ